MKPHPIPKTVSVLELPDRDRWLAVRARDVTASVAGALFDVHEYTSRLELWGLKSGQIAPEELNSAALLRGELLEPVAVEMMRRERPDWQIDHNTGDRTRYFRDPAARLGATPDTLVWCPERGPGTVQIKSVEQGTYRRKWCPDGVDPEPPLWIAIQAILEAYLTGSQWACVAPLVVGHGIEMPLIDIPLVDDVVPSLIDRADAFWKSVENGTPPAADYAKDAAVIDAMFPVDDGGEVDLVADRRAYALVERRAEISDQKKVVDAELAAIDAELKLKMGTAHLAYLPGGMRMTWRTQRRRNPDGTASAWRVLRVPRPKDRVLKPRPDPEPPAPPKRPRKDEPWNF